MIFPNQNVWLWAHHCWILTVGFQLWEIDSLDKFSILQFIMVKPTVLLELLIENGKASSFHFEDNACLDARRWMSHFNMLDLYAVYISKESWIL